VPAEAVIDLFMLAFEVEGGVSSEDMIKTGLGTFGNALEEKNSRELLSPWTMVPHGGSV
jgi:hypothetical protein